jgi:ribonuclease PH|tara:strand:+ start:343 stop:1056 length:714 start_codon:yes stop_codon:yes gene_type:complete
MRQDREFQDLRSISFETDINVHAEGSCLVKFGNTHVLCTASIDEKIPHWLKNSGRGWITAEYGMLPRSTNTRIDREAVKGKQSGRTQEIQRLIGRSLRAVVNLENIGERQIKIDCDVIQADGGTRTASISGGYVALYKSIEKMKKNYNINKPIIREFVAAVSAGLIDSKPYLDLNYEEDSRAQVDANFVICESNKIVEIQITGEEYSFTKEQFQEIFNLSQIGISKIIKKQKEVLNK